MALPQTAVTPKVDSTEQKPEVKAEAAKTIIHSPSGDRYSVTLSDGTGYQLPVITADKDVIAGLQELADHHKGLVVIEKLADYEDNAEKAAKAATQE